MRARRGKMMKGRRGKQTDERYVQMAVILSQTKAVFVFFPYRKRNTLYSNAIVTPACN